ncbi:MAG TPA: hypothetical protein VMW56_22825 [Candidatus Margulisiibacteriota bacterium]|nr:hypothetical protein [Candidatus Margulisiibacteriota bacterium]
MNDSEIWALKEKFADLTAAIRETLSTLARMGLVWQGEFSSLEANDKAILKLLGDINTAVALGKTLNDLPNTLALRMLSSMSAEQLASQVPADVINMARRIQWESMKRNGEALPLGPPPSTEDSSLSRIDRPPSIEFDTKGVKVRGRFRWHTIKKNWHTIALVFGTVWLAIKHALTVWPH